MLSSQGDFINIDSISGDMKVRTNTIINQFHPVSRQPKFELFNSQCLSLYGCPLWNLNDHKLEELYKTWRICCRRLLELDPRTKSYVLPHIMNSFDISDIIKERFINFFIGGVNHKSVEISNFFKNTLVSCSSIAVTNINTILNKWNMNYHQIFTDNKNRIRKIMINSCNTPDWRCIMIRELLHILDGTLNNPLSRIEINQLLSHVCTVI